MGVYAALLILARRSAGLAWAISAELAWHLAGQAWAFAVLAAGLGWVAARIPAAVAAASSKAYAVETRVDALVPVVATVQSTANTAQSTANNALAIVPPNHSFLSGLSTATTGSVGTGSAAGSVPGVSANVAGSVPSVNADVSGNPGSTYSQSYLTALAGNVNELRADVINEAFYVGALRDVCYNALRGDVVSLRNYVAAFAGTYNQTVSAVNHIQDQLNAHGYSST